MKSYRIHDGESEWFVRGTDDPQVAMEFLVEDEPDSVDHLFEEDRDHDIEYVPLAERTGWFYFVPCSPRSCGEHAWHLGYGNGPGRGKFLGVLLDVGAREIEFEIDRQIELAEVG